MVCVSTGCAPNTIKDKPRFVDLKSNRDTSGRLGELQDALSTKQVFSPQFRDN